eukprot:TRINITY_DN1760_c0_g1_i1.p2 TRINITY_DN1760_c0_g1~~TRINITY_DN1760_c0_g1_i1.p2  ORF type:complete len:148 (+),score=9.88 TRINITY_DN1760_c0_g1_i1:298-741(+)
MSAYWCRTARKDNLEKTNDKAWTRITGGKRLEKNGMLRRAGERVIHGLACGQHPITIPAMTKGTPKPKHNHHGPCPLCGAETRDAPHILLDCIGTGLSADLPVPDEKRAEAMRKVLSQARDLIMKLVAYGDLPGKVNYYIKPEPEPD